MPGIAAIESATRDHARLLLEPLRPSSIIAAALEIEAPGPERPPFAGAEFTSDDAGNAGRSARGGQASPFSTRSCGRP